MKKSTLKIALMGAVIFGLTACGGNKAENETAEATATEQNAGEEQSMDEESPADEAEIEAPVVEEVAVEEVAADSKDSKEAKEPKGDGYKTTASGLKYKVLKQGKGKSPKATDVVTVHYEGKLLDGTVFDSSYQRGEPTSFPLNRVIQGWTEGLQLMNEGSIYELYIPYRLAYGEQGTPGGPIPPKADLIFKVELLKVQ